jgi:acetylornithine/succinyldiaminopimelate/putrescine aminotransferase
VPDAQSARQAYSRQHVRVLLIFALDGNDTLISLVSIPHSIRFAPPLVIEEADLRKAVRIIKESLEEIDVVSDDALHLLDWEPRA